MQKKSIFLLAVLSAVPFIMVLGNSMLIPVLPEMKEALGVSQLRTSLAITLFSVPAGLTIPLAGFLSDRINRRTIIAAALLIYGLGGVIAGTAWLLFKSQAYFMIMAGRIIQGIGAAGTAPIAMALTGDIFTSSERSKALGVLEAGNGLGKVVSPVLGAAVGLFAWWAVFFLFPVLCLPIALGVWFVVKEPQKKHRPPALKQYVQSLKKIFQEKGVSLSAAFLSGSVVLFTLFGVLFYLSDYLETRYGIDGIPKGLILAVPVLAMTIASYGSGRIGQKKTEAHKLMILTGIGLLTAAMAAAPFFQENTYVLIGALVIAGLGTGLVLPALNTLITGSCGAEERGMITSLYGGVRFFGVAAGPPAFSLLMSRSAMLTFLVPAVLTALSWGVVLFFLKQQVMRKNDKK